MSASTENIIESINTLPALNFEQPFIELLNGDEYLENKNYGQAILHYLNVLSSIKCILNAGMLDTEEKISKYVNECGVRDSYKINY